MAKRTRTFKQPETFTRCPRCGGTGCPPGAAVDAMRHKRFGEAPHVCGQCGGKGKVPGVPVEETR